MNMNEPIHHHHARGARIAEQLNAARLPGEKCEYIVDRDDAVMLRLKFRGAVHHEPIWCEWGLRYVGDGLDPAIVTRTHSNTKFRITKRLQKKYLK